MSIFDKLFPGRARSAPRLGSAEIASKIEAQKAARAAAQARVDASGSKHKAALDALDAPGIVAAEDATALARAEVQVADHAIRELRAAHAEALQAEELQAFRDEVAAATRQGEQAKARLDAEYPGLAAALAALLSDLSAYAETADGLRKRARDLGETIDLPTLQPFLAGPQHWRASWPNPEGTHLGTVWGDVKDAPRGAIRWEDGKPVPAREGVRIEPRQVESRPSVLKTVSCLPGLRFGEADYWPPSKPVERVEPRGYVDRTQPRKHAPVSALGPSPHDDPRRESER